MLLAQLATPRCLSLPLDGNGTPAVTVDTNTKLANIIISLYIVVSLWFRKSLGP